jgi:formylglycine-generating enzyme required for sulfatase activity
MAAAAIIALLVVTACPTDGDSTNPPPKTGSETDAGKLMTRTVSGKEIKFRYVPDGKFQRDYSAANVTVITQGYWLGETEVTQELFQAVMGTNPSYFTDSVASGETQAKRPVETVNWYAAIAFCNKLSVLDEKQPVYNVSGITDWSTFAYSSIPTSSNSTWDAVTQDLSKNGYRLPTEMEWMWAAMGANTTGYSKAFAGSNGSNSIGEYAWYYSNSDSKTHEVGKKTANELNLFDMSGNVYEWVWDWYGSYSSGELTDLTGPASGTARVIRGGSWLHDASFCAVALRNDDAPRLSVLLHRVPGIGCPLSSAGHRISARLTTAAAPLNGGAVAAGNGPKSVRWVTRPEGSTRRPPEIGRGLLELV